MMRVPVIAGNWKMNMTLSEARELVLGVQLCLKFPGAVEVVVAPPFTALNHVANILKDSYLDVAAQNIHEQDRGAFTGEVSGEFIKDAGANFVIIGHSERRQYFKETDELVGKKIAAALRQDLKPIVCVGETLSEREAGEHFSVIQNQMTHALSQFSETELWSLIIAYEPVWAIGTGQTASTDQIAEIHFFIRSLLKEIFSQKLSEQTRLLYGGSVNPANSREILALEHVDGALVGGASLKVGDFVAIIRAAIV